MGAKKLGALSRSRTCTERDLKPPPLPVGLSARARRGNRTRTLIGLSRWPPPLGYADLNSHRLERAVERHVDQHRSTILERLGKQISRLVHRFGALGLDAKRAR